MVSGGDFLVLFRLWILASLALGFLGDRVY